MDRLKLFLPVIVFAIVAAVFFAVESRIAKNEYSATDLPSALIGKPLPDFELPVLQSDTLLKRKHLIGKPFLINVWATWCPTCHYEHPFLMELEQRGEIDIVGLDYKDNAERAAEWLAKLGDPYKVVLFDAAGKLGLDLGVTGAPETYFVDAEGIVRFRFQGALDESVWQQKFVPVIRRYSVVEAGQASVAPSDSSDAGDATKTADPKATSESSGE